MTIEQMKLWIDTASYTDLLRCWRSEPLNSPWFEGEMAAYFDARLLKKRREVGVFAHIAASRAVGWRKLTSV